MSKRYVFEPADSVMRVVPDEYVGAVYYKTVGYGGGDWKFVCFANDFSDGRNEIDRQNLKFAGIHFCKAVA